MKIKLSELKKIIQKESQTLKEQSDEDQAQAWGEYAVGTLLDVERQKRVEFELTSLYMNAMTDAMGDMGDDDEARETVNLAVQTMFNEWLEKQQPNRRGSR